MENLLSPSDCQLRELEESMEIITEPGGIFASRMRGSQVLLVIGD
jgi:hypothetical protein